MKVLIIDNYDSFTYNLYQAVGEILESRIQNLEFRIDVVRNDGITLSEIVKRQYNRIILSPGPGNPADRKYFGVCADILQQVKTIPILGVCLGMQGMAYYFGGKVIRAKEMMHGKTSVIVHDGKGIFAGVPQNIEAMRYHSLVVEPANLPEYLEVSSYVKESKVENLPSSGGVATGRGGYFIQGPHRSALTLPLSQGERGSERGEGISYIEVMGLRHKTLPMEGVQFHPESFATEDGKKILENFLFQKDSRCTIQDVRREENI